MIYCPACGYPLADGAKFCPKCGAKVSSGALPGKLSRGESSVSQGSSAKFFSNTAVEQVKNVYDDVKGGIKGEPNSKKLETNRSLAAYIFLTIITCGLYSYFFIYSLARDVNTACEGDGQKTQGIVGFIFLCLITCGFYSLVWQYSIANRLAENAQKYELCFQENGTTVLLWSSLSLMTFFMSRLMIMNILIKNTNRICDAYNQAHGL